MEYRRNPKKRKRNLVDILTEVGVAGILVIDPVDPTDPCPGGSGGGADDCYAQGWTPEQTREWQRRHRMHPHEFRALIALRRAAAAGDTDGMHRAMRLLSKKERAAVKGVLS